MKIFLRSLMKMIRLSVIIQQRRLKYLIVNLTIVNVYSASVTFATEADFGAAVSFGESIFSDHVVELYFENYGVVDNVLNG